MEVTGGRDLARSLRGVGMAVDLFWRLSQPLLCQSTVVVTSGAERAIGSILDLCRTNNPMSGYGWQKPMLP